LAKDILIPCITLGPICLNVYYYVYFLVLVLILKSYICYNFVLIHLFGSILLSNLLIQQSKGFESKQKIFSEEFELVTQALFTDPSDQSGWFYHLWLLAQTSSPDNPQLIASWPSNAAKLTSSLIKEKDEQHTLSSIWSRAVPIVLYFNEPVKGLNQSSVNLKSDLEFDKDIQWRPLTLADSGYSNC